ncbi:deoxyuridine 5'-triphosphate nucleotidohydrolase [Anaerovirgula multivorans]|uniref:dUTP diphosphatase n=1 Tax=Anaerovirgula multivorans TaxID=312168 RepID=A0A239CM62_9FIRM|nr:hypothetical protein [Anaerovirgula multivorans]SNS20781.1 deoxyuridine 5'-triphosphate nucleotidohydrolase [Anaerovirgula multivorans]
MRETADIAGLMQAKLNQLERGSKACEMRYKRFDKSFPPLSKEDGNAGYDVFARLKEPLVLQPMESGKVPLNVAIEVPYGGVGFLCQRSSTFRKWGVRLTNGVGIGDPLFRGSDDEYTAELQNMTDKPVTIKNGDKICQIVFLPTLPVVPVEVDELENKNRGGFGTTFNNAEEIK